MNLSKRTGGHEPFRHAYLDLTKFPAKHAGLFVHETGQIGMSWHQVTSLREEMPVGKSGMLSRRVPLLSGTADTAVVCLGNLQAGR